jgi:tetratricopeptide (TPR) repeat protein
MVKISNLYFLTIITTLLLIESAFSQTAEDYYSDGVKKFNQSDYSGAISDFSRAIELKSNYDYAYCKRGDVKSILKNYKGAIEDYNQGL